MKDALERLYDDLTETGFKGGIIVCLIALGLLSAVIDGCSGRAHEHIEQVDE